MAEELVGTCKCGYSGTAISGGTHATFLTELPEPHRCRSCKSLVTVDVWKELACPLCSSPDVEPYETTSKELPNTWMARLRYGRLSDSELFKRGFHRYSRVLTGAILDRWHTCPRCEQRTMRFKLDAVFYYSPLLPQLLERRSRLFFGHLLVLENGVRFGFSVMGGFEVAPPTGGTSPVTLL